MAESVVRVAVLASGEGTNAERLILAARNRPDVDVALVASNRPDAGVLARAAALGVPTWTFDRTALADGTVNRRLREEGIAFVALAGFLLKVPAELVRAFEGRMLNLHPSLLPAFGGKGMFGRHVHEAVYAALCEGSVRETGITLHWVDAAFDEGPLFHQVRIALDPASDTPGSIARKVASLEAEHYAGQTLRAISEALSLSRA